MGTARLVIVKDRQHRFLEMTDPVISFGRAPDNTIPLDDDMASRRHCVIERDRDGHHHTIRDLHSFNGTYLNGEPLKSTERLHCYDAIQVGQTFLFYLDEKEGTAGFARFPVSQSSHGMIRPDMTSSGAVTMAHAESAAAQAAASVSDEEAKDALKNMLLLQELSKAINSELDIDNVLKLIMDTAIDLVKAERGFIILVDAEGKMDIVVAHNFNHDDIHTSNFAISRNILNKVINSREPILSTNAATDFMEYASIVDLELRSLMCAPLICKETVLGVLYLDSRLVEARFTQTSLNLLQTFADVAAIGIENARLVGAVREKERLDQELRIASRIQNELLPRENPKVTGLEVCGRMLTAKEVGGDYFDFVQFEGEESIYCCIGDVSGKGVPAGLIMVMARSTLRPFISSYYSTKKILVATNRILKGDLKKGMFMSMILAHWSAREGKVRFTGAGHERLIVYRAATREIEVIGAGGIILGVVPDVEKMLNEMELVLAPGDQLVMYTDGVTEARIGKGEQFGMERLQEIVRENGHKSAPELAEAVVRAVEPFGAGTDQQHDDITLITMRRE